MTYNRISTDMTRAEALAIADWHMEKSKEEGDRHDMIAFRIYKLLHAGVFG